MADKTGVKQKEIQMAAGWDELIPAGECRDMTILLPAPSAKGQFVFAPAGGFELANVLWHVYGGGQRDATPVELHEAGPCVVEWATTFPVTRVDFTVRNPHPEARRSIGSLVACLIEGKAPRHA